MSTLTLNESKLATHLTNNQNGLRNTLYERYHADQKIQAIKDIREFVRTLIGEPLSLMASKNEIERLWAYWDEVEATRSSAGWRRIEANNREVKIATIQNVSAFITRDEALDIIKALNL